MNYNNEKIIEFIKKIPKTELHLHIEGTLEPEHLFKLAKRNDIQIPFASVNEIKSAYNFSNLESFLNIKRVLPNRNEKTIKGIFKDGELVELQ